MRLQAAQTGTAPLEMFLQSSRASGDFQLDLDLADASQPQHGTIMMVAGRAMVSKGLSLPPGAELGVLDRPLLMYALLSSILTRVLPGGPDSTVPPQRISHVDTALGISYATAAARGYVPAPWSVEGSLKPTGNRTFQFDLLLRWSDNHRPIKAGLTGTLQRRSDFHLDDSTELDGLGVYSLEYQSGYVAKPIRDPPKTIGDLRRQLAAPPAKAAAPARK